MEIKRLEKSDEFRKLFAGTLEFTSRFDRTLDEVFYMLMHLKYGKDVSVKKCGEDVTDDFLRHHKNALDGMKYFLRYLEGVDIMVDGDIDIRNVLFKDLWKL